MAISVTIEDFENKCLTRFTDSKNAFHDILNYCYHNPTIVKVFKYIDLYDDTVFNSLQIQELLNDIEALKKISNLMNSKNHNLLENLIKLCNQALQTPHLYLKFYGD